MVGAGGGFLIVPYLLLVKHATPDQAAGTSIAVVFLNALSGTIAYVRQKRVDYRAGVWFAIATVPGAIGGAFLSSAFSGRTFDMVFALCLLMIAAYLLWRPVNENDHARTFRPGRWAHERILVDAHGETHRYAYDLRLGIALSVLVGFLSSVLGIGGGIIHVPALIHLLGFPAHLATATSHFILAITALIGATTHASLGHVLGKPALFMGIGVVAGAQVGARYGQRIKGPLLIRMLSFALIIVALRLVLR